jgi:hypothetical protein
VTSSCWKRVCQGRHPYRLALLQGRRPGGQRGVGQRPGRLRLPG